MSVVISQGFNRSHLAPLAAEMDRRGELAALFTGAWPRGAQRRLASRLPGSRRWRRFIDRTEEIADERIRAFVWPEVLWQFARICGPRAPKLHDTLSLHALRAYARLAEGANARIKPKIYHYRSCFGLCSVSSVKRAGAVALCDHSIAHPAVLSSLVRKGGQLPPREEIAPGDPFERLMQVDINQADHTLVNSDFVKSTCVYAGMDAERIHVVYLGIDENFRQAIPPFDADQVARRPDRVLYAGGWQVRKGAWTIVETLADAPRSWQMTIAGEIEPQLSSDAKMRAFLARPQVDGRGVLARSELARCMIEHPIFIFPSLCEGSARVVFEALACGCYIITTPNAGSIVRDGVHGRLISPGDSGALRSAIEWAKANRQAVAQIGWQNALLVQSRYTQHTYGNQVSDLYAHLRGQAWNGATQNDIIH